MRFAIAAAIGASLLSQPDAVDAVRNRLDGYLIAYEPQLSVLVADEEMTQRTRERKWVVTNRRIQSEVAFVALPGDAGWLGFRRVLTVNGRPIKDRGIPLGRLLAEETSTNYEQARQLLAESAVHNLGAPRTINLPNLPLEMLHPRNRHRFAAEIFGHEKIAGLQTTLLRMNETASPTIIQQKDGGDMKTVVWAWVDASTGTLLRAQVTTRDARIGMPAFDAVIRVDFRKDDRLGIVVPHEMTETFFVGRNDDPGNGTARYSNYRRFQTSARIVPQ